jgi:hypothetical protein
LGLFFNFNFTLCFPIVVVVVVDVAVVVVVVVVVDVVSASHFHTKYIKFHLTLALPSNFPQPYSRSKNCTLIAFPYFLHQRQK